LRGAGDSGAANAARRLRPLHHWRATDTLTAKSAKAASPWRPLSLSA
jgi:hypothetical protein